MFVINNLLVSCSNDILFYLGTIIISSVDSPYFLILGGVVVLINILAMMLFMRAER